ncbi:hypothetical protein [Swingsia samuiensis]|nr:hypothetical protein [Swingsia samuiensis]
MKKLLLVSLALTSLGLSLSACGKKNAPEPAGPASEVIYPRNYPAQ